MIIIIIIIIIIYIALLSYSFIALYIDYVWNISFNTQELYNPYDSFFFFSNAV